MLSFALRPPSLGSENREMEEKFLGFLQLRCVAKTPRSETRIHHGITVEGPGGRARTRRR